ncbi:DUF1705 domain-containing protein [Parabacteroides sp. 52]|uniref:phosphoethanolamine transferase n=1 Tax=unclassified Parabacteroides TaxID=2649774 RepID=UPI0013D608A2|nr:MULTISPECIES: phosphoethanolamine transferase [unclassified Parabacteroides]MDH6534755.1 glucan phosphoethanolaminetransferase (alkaline phosphatase superfamily) [Parabacteroides sp. PM5-20]NDV55761.1 DUF1705 domain-containing protein [Parabacteroides sp. 52]
MFHIPVNKLLFRFCIFSFLTALFVSIFLTSADFLKIPVTTAKDVFILLLQWGVIFTANFFLIFLLAVNKYVFALIFPLVTFISSLLAWFRFTMNAILTPMILDATLENDFRTSSELCTPGLVFFVLLMLLISLFIVYYRIKHIKLEKPLVVACVTAVLLVCFTQIDGLKRPISKRIPFNIYYTVVDYCKEKQMISMERMDLTEGIRCGEEDDLIVVFVLGESLRPDHLGINGYERNTTPLLSQEDIISFPHIYTEFTYTNRSVPYILTRADSTDYGRAFTEKSFVNLFNACDYYTVWLANQEPTDTYVYFMNECDSLFHVNIEKSSYVFDKWVDGDLLPLYDDALQVANKKKLIILNGIGSHWWYNSHFTDEFAVFTPIIKSKILSSNTQQEMINSYDNTVLYTDYFLYNVIERLRDKKAIFIYQSDHGEALGEDGMWLHASESPFPHQAACLIWMSPAYKESFPEHYIHAKENSSKRYRTDYLFHSILDAGKIESPYLDTSQSIFRK